jgi:hypothetical protein
MNLEADCWRKYKNSYIDLEDIDDVQRTKYIKSATECIINWKLESVSAVEIKIAV